MGCASGNLLRDGALCMAGGKPREKGRPELIHNSLPPGIASRKGDNSNQDYGSLDFLKYVPGNFQNVCKETALKFLKPKSGPYRNELLFPVDICFFFYLPPPSP